jgi:DNA-binding response OmpR family regulator
MPRVLVADDVPEIVGVLRILLELWGYEVRTALDGLEAVQVVGLILVEFRSLIPAIAFDADDLALDALGPLPK